MCIHTPRRDRVTNSVSRTLNKPYYVLRPSQAFRRLRWIGTPPPAGLVSASLPWGGEMDVRPSEAVGSSIWRTGVFELAVSETIARLIDPGELAMDVGANIGYMTRLMASRAGVTGCVLAFEPHPALHSILARNSRRAAHCARIEARQVALSDRSGEGLLAIGADFQRNMGTASLSGRASSAPNAALPVRVERLDDELPPNASVGLMKLDVEGHELNVLRGARRALAEQRIRDIVFEDSGTPPTPVTRVLDPAGYTIFGLRQGFLGPRLVAPGSADARPLWDAPTYLATRDVARARHRMRARGWSVLKDRS